MRKLKHVPVRPVTLEEGSWYFLRRKSANQRPQSWKPVRFISYTPCPAVVIVATQPGKRISIAREELFMEEKWLRTLSPPLETAGQEAPDGLG